MVKRVYTRIKKNLHNIHRVWNASELCPIYPILTLLPIHQMNLKTFSCSPASSYSFLHTMCAMCISNNSKCFVFIYVYVYSCYPSNLFAALELTFKESIMIFFKCDTREVNQSSEVLWYPSLNAHQNKRSTFQNKNNKYK